MSMTDQRPSLPPPSRPARHGLIEDWRDGLWILLLLAAAAFLGALLTRLWPDTEDNVSVADLNARIATLEASIAKNSTRDVTALKDRVAKIESRQRSIETALAAGSLGANLAAAGASLVPGAPAIGTAPQVAAAPTDLATRLAALEAKTAKTPDDIKATKESLDKLTATVTAVDGRLAKLENSDLVDLARRASLATAIANLTRAAQGSAPFKTEFDIVAAMLPNDPRLAEVAPLAEKGLPTAGTLIAAFGNAADAAIDAETASKGRTWWDRLWSHFAALFSTRAIGETEGYSTEARLARGEVRLKAGDLSAAVKELGAIGGPARDVLADWLTQAKARVHLETSLADVNTRAIEALQAPAPPAPQPPAKP
jgi:hypothetical protein